MKVFLIIGVALLGLALASGSVEVFAAAFGAFAGYALAEMISSRRRVEDLERELSRLRTQVAGSRSEAAGTAPEKPSTAAPEPATARSAAAREYFNEQGAAANATGPAAAGTSETREPPASKWQPAPAPPQPPEELAVFRWVREYFTGGNTLVRVGIVILFIGVAFLLRYAAEHTHVPIELRLSGVALAGVVLLALGWRLRVKRPGYALALQGGAIGVLYLTVFAALRLFHVLPASQAFAVLAVLSVFSAALAILQNSMAFALLAIGCGFLAPILASSGQGDHVVLFSYYALLNLGILVIAWFKAWRPLNVAGFLFTFIIGTAWGVLRYGPALLRSTEPFLIGFFLLYIAIAILFSLRQQPVLRGYVDGTLVFGTPVVAFGLQSAMVHDWHFALAYSALAVSALYLVLAALLYRGQRETQRLLVEAFMALGVAFLTLAVPLALDGRWSAATWALEGAALVWIGCRQGRLLPRASGALLQIASGVIFLFDLDAPHGSVPVLNSAYLGGVMIAFASVFAAHTLNKAREHLNSYEQPFSPVLFFWGLLWWLISGTTEIGRHVADPYAPASILVFLAATALISSGLHRRLAISVARLVPLALLPVMVVFALLELDRLSHPFANGGWAAWPLAFAAFYLLCRRHEAADAHWPAKAFHAVSALLLTALITWEFAWQVDQAINGGGSWPAIAWALVPAIAVYVLPKLAARFPWPFGRYQEAYVAAAGAVLAAYLVLWSLGTNFTMRGDPYPLPYVPIVNPLDLAQVLVLLVLARYGLHLHKAKYRLLSELKPPQLVWILAVLAFVWLNAALLRTLHHWAGVPFEIEALFGSTLVQTALTIFWTVLALATMLFATRRASRVVWIAGAVLMGVVVGKLFLIDLSRIGTVERIVSFVGVGLLMLVVGYFSPLPPARKVTP